MAFVNGIRIRTVILELMVQRYVILFSNGEVVTSLFDLLSCGAFLARLKGSNLAAPTLNVTALILVVFNFLQAYLILCQLDDITLSRYFPCDNKTLSIPEDWNV